MDTLQNFCTEYITQGDYRFKCHKPAIHEGPHEAKGLEPLTIISWQIVDEESPFAQKPHWEKFDRITDNDD
jgi:hypothetical protein